MIIDLMSNRQKEDTPMRICYWGTYDRDYPRNKIIIKGLKANGVLVDKCHYQLWESTSQKVQKAKGSWWNIFWVLYWTFVYVYLFIKFFSLRQRYDFIFVGFSGHFDVFVAKLISIVTATPLVFDAYLSLYDSIVCDRKTIPPTHLKAKLLFLVDKYSSRLADIVLLDTNAHIQYFVEHFYIPKEKCLRVFIGADDDIFKPASAVHNGKKAFKVVHFGRYIPLHGLEFIVGAAKLLEQYTDIEFIFIGDGELKETMVALVEKKAIKNITFLPSMPQSQLAEYLHNADLCLGIFGISGKAARVIPNKVYEALAMKKAVITGDSPGARELLVHEKNALLCPMGNPGGLAQAILRLYADRELKALLEKDGYRLYTENATPAKIGEVIKERLIMFQSNRNKKHC